MLEKLFNPRSVAVIGASRDPGKVGHDVVRNLLSFGYPGKIYPVNPKAQRILDLPCYASLKEVPGPVDLAVIAVPVEIVPQVITDCGQKEVPVAVILSAGFKEAGSEGARLETEVIKTPDNTG
ncbi:CoA-binding protein [Thermosulfuriphilus sp.]